MIKLWLAELKICRLNLAAIRENLTAVEFNDERLPGDRLWERVVMVLASALGSALLVSLL